jgi:hypothetical protein
MPPVDRTHIGVALDMFGCPNRCRHCWLGQAPGGRMTEDDLRWVVAQFREFQRPGDDQPFWRQLRVSTWAREPDFSPDYRRLYDLEQELSDLPSQRSEYELLSAWRLARDAEYAEWGYSIGVRVCQLTFFGLEAVTDWAHRRRGAFQDLLIATERLLAAGIRPRWQWFLTKRILLDLPGLIALAETLRLRERCETLGGPFALFLHCPSPDGESWHLEHLRPTAKELEQIPAWLREQSEKHIGQPIGRPEAKLVPRMLEERNPTLGAITDISEPCGLWLHVTPAFDVYCNYWEIAPPWRLGNLKTDGMAAILDALENDRPPGLHAAFRVPVSELARRFGRPRGRRLYTPDDLKTRWVHLWVETHGGTAGGPSCAGC